jgi:comEA protein
MLNLTRQERVVIQFLVLFFVIGSGIRLYQGWLAARNTIEFPESSQEAAEFRNEAAQVDSMYWAKEVTTGMADKVRINLNSATLEDLMKLSKIGKVNAQRIIDYRSEHGHFTSVDELLNVKGIGKKTLEIIRGEITLE